jgi:hypothetical protein
MNSRPQYMYIEDCYFSAVGGNNFSYPIFYVYGKLRMKDSYFHDLKINTYGVIYYTYPYYGYDCIEVNNTSFRNIQGGSSYPAVF